MGTEPLLECRVQCHLHPRCHLQAPVHPPAPPPAAAFLRFEHLHVCPRRCHVPPAAAPRLTPLPPGSHSPTRRRPQPPPCPPPPPGGPLKRAAAAPRLTPPPRAATDLSSANKKLNKSQQLKKTFQRMWCCGVSFHIGISSVSLAIYLSVSSGVDMTAVLCKLGFSESSLQSKRTAGTLRIICVPIIPFLSSWCRIFTLCQMLVDIFIYFLCSVIA
uniref:DUF1279 domain-containing protein n=1 Tax=Cairina moschata TaxID=8855 RepID=A0A8C3CXC3_CAIMO